MATVCQVGEARITTAHAKFVRTRHRNFPGNPELCGIARALPSFGGTLSMPERRDAGRAARRESQMSVVRARRAAGGSGRARAPRRSGRDPRHLPAPRAGILSYLAVTLVPGSSAAVGGESE